MKPTFNQSERPPAPDPVDHERCIQEQERKGHAAIKLSYEAQEFYNAHQILMDRAHKLQASVKLCRKYMSMDEIQALIQRQIGDIYNI